MTWRRTPAGLASGPTRFMRVGTPSSRRTGETCRIAGCIAGANMNTIPASARTRAMTGTGASSGMPSASSRSALPQREVYERLPCLATRTPAPAATNAATVEMLNVVTTPPPVPHVSTSSSGRSAGSGTITRRSARTAPVSSDDVSPRARMPMSNAPIWADVASPDITASNASPATPSARDSPSAMVRSAPARPPSGTPGGGAVTRRATCASGGPPDAHGVRPAR